MKFGMGQPVTRREDIRFLTGTGQYVDDVPADGVLIARVLRSPVAHGRMTALDVAEARTLPGVHSVLTHADIADRLTPMTCAMPVTQADGTPAATAPQPHLANGTVRFVGEPVAWIVAESAAAAEDAAEAILLDIEDLPPLPDSAAARAPGAPALHPHLPGNRLYTWSVGDRAAAEAALAGSAHVVRAQVLNQRVVVASMEPRAILATHDTESGWEIWIGSQGSHAMKRMMAKDLGVSPDLIRIHTPDVGGGFGMKLMDHPEYALALLSAADLGRPVKWVGDRSESFLSDSQGRGIETEAAAGFDAEGRLTGLLWHSVSNVGAYNSTASNAVHTAFSANLIGGVYDVRAVYHEVTGVVTNTTPMDAYRGAGRPEVLHVMERLMGAGAAALGLDPAEIRRRNVIRPEQLPYKTVGGITFDSLEAAAILDRAAEVADVAGFAAR
ncbi:MAG: molybdopterin cofactor-binding domain-containing protein, partial [Pseudomonadota bacterium]